MSVGIIIAFGARTARAQSAEPSGDQARTHDGFYVRAAAGFAVYDERLSTSGAGADIKGRTRGISSLSELAFGGTLARGWVVGGGIYTADLGDRQLSHRDRPAARRSSTQSCARWRLLGPFFDRYFDPTGGLHFQVALGLAWLSPRAFGDEATEQSEYLALGGGVMLGIGQEFWISDTWSLGVLARTTISYLKGEDTTESELAAPRADQPGPDGHADLSVTRTVLVTGRLRQGERHAECYPRAACPPDSPPRLGRHARARCAAPSDRPRPSEAAPARSTPPAR